jgi:hypothetical protein
MQCFEKCGYQGGRLLAAPMTAIRNGRTWNEALCIKNC